MEDGQLEGQDWCTYLSHLPTKEGFKALISEVKHTCWSEIATMRQDLKVMAYRVDSLKTMMLIDYASQLRSQVLTQTKALETPVAT